MRLTRRPPTFPSLCRFGIGAACVALVVTSGCQTANPGARMHAEPHSWSSSPEHAAAPGVESAPEARLPADHAERVQAILAAAASTPIDWDQQGDNDGRRDAHVVAQAKFALGRDEAARQIIRRSLAYPWSACDDPEASAWHTMACYMRWKDVIGKYTPELKAATRARFEEDLVTPGRGGGAGSGTRTRRWMRAVALHLARHAWPDASVTPFTRDDPDGAGFIASELEAIVRRSHAEILSDTCNIHVVGPILTLRDASPDPELRRRAELALDWIMVHHSAFFFKGHCGGPARRTTAPLTAQDGNQDPDALYFGGPVAEWDLAYVPCALSDYRPPPVTHAMAWDRDRPFSTRASYRSDDVTVRSQSHVNREYVLFSAYEMRNRMGLSSTWRHAALRWAVRWDAPPHQLSTFFVKHPCSKQGRLPGDTWCHQFLQHDHSLIGVLNIPTERPSTFAEDRHWVAEALGVFPHGHRAIIREPDKGRLWLHCGTVLIGFAATEPMLLSETGAPHGEFRFPSGVYGLKLGYMVETTRPSDVAGTTAAEKLAAFRDTVAPTFDRAEFSLPGLRPQLAYTTAGGTHMVVAWRPPGEDTLRMVHGRMLPDLDNDRAWPLLENPWIAQEVDGDVLSIDHRGVKLRYDFAEWSVDGERY